MMRRSREGTFMWQLGSAPHWGKPRGNLVRPRSKRSAFIARLTIDVAPDLRARSKVAALERGITVTYMLRLLLLEAFPRTKGRMR